MLVIHVYVKGKSGAVERTYDFLRNDGKDGFEGIDVVIPYDNEHNHYPLTESAAIAYLAGKDLRGGH